MDRFLLVLHSSTFFFFGNLTNYFGVSLHSCSTYFEFDELMKRIQAILSTLILFSYPKTNLSWFIVCQKKRGPSGNFERYRDQFP